jgi:hypothetical protein
VFTLDQATFDRQMGDRSFALADYFSLTFSAAAVPEPSSWMMMLVGFGILGGALRYRRRSTEVVYG